jgi:hypothetical protein
MNQLKLIALLIIMPCTIMHAAKEHDTQSQIDNKSHLLSPIGHFMLNAIIDKKLRSLSSVDFFQNQSQLISAKLRAQQIGLLSALSKNNDELLRNLNDPAQQRDTRSLLSSSRELLALITDINKYLNSTSV